MKAKMQLHASGLLQTSSDIAAAILEISIRIKMLVAAACHEWGVVEEGVALSSTSPHQIFFLQ